MATKRFKTVTPNYHKRVLEIAMKEGKNNLLFQLPFSVFSDLAISSTNKFTSIQIDPATGQQSVLFELQNKSRGDFATDFVLYHCDPTYEWSAINQLKATLNKKMQQSGFSIRVLAKALNTSPAQILRLLTENKIAKQWQQLCKLAQLVGLKLHVTLDPVG